MWHSSLAAFPRKQTNPSESNSKCMIKAMEKDVPAKRCVGGSAEAAKKIGTNSPFALASGK